jgi:hypothetical protein
LQVLEQLTPLGVEAAEAAVAAEAVLLNLATKSLAVLEEAVQAVVAVEEQEEILVTVLVLLEATQVEHL